MPRISIHEAPPLTDEQRRRLEATTDADIARHMAEDDGVDLAEQPIEALDVVRSYPDPRDLRLRLKMTQVEFAQAFGVKLWTLRDWEQHKSLPEGPARTLLRVIDRDPEAVRRALVP